MTQQFMEDATIQELYNFPAGSVFEDTFSAVSLEISSSSSAICF